MRSKRTPPPGNARWVRVEQTARQLRVTLPAPPDDRPLVFQEIEVYGSEQAAPEVRYLLSADLCGTGASQTLVVSSANELVTLDADGRELWRYQYAGEVNHISCHDLFDDRRQYICAGLPGGYLVILAPDGSVYKDLALAETFFAKSGLFMGWLYTIHSICVWQRDASGRAALALGSYSIVVFLDADENVIGHSWADAPWIVDLLAVPAGEAGGGDVWARCGWNHGIGRYAGQAGFAPSGEGVVFSGVRQPMFRALRKIIPFVNGRTAAFEWFTGDPDLGRVIVAAAEDGVGVLSLRTEDFLWSAAGGTTITACLCAAADGGQAEVRVGGVDGFVSAFNLADGKPLRAWQAGAPVVGLLELPGAGLWIAATRRGLWALARDWQVRAFIPAQVMKICPAGARGITAALQDGSLASFQF